MCLLDRTVDCVTHDAEVGDVVPSEPDTDAVATSRTNRKRLLSPDLELCDAKQPGAAMFVINFSVVRRTYRTFNQTNQHLNHQCLLVAGG